MRDENGKMRLRPATLIAMLALFIAIGGTATAASKLINGKTIKKGTVAGKAFKNKTITEAKISTASLAALAGTTTLFESGTKVAQAPNVTVDQVVMDDLPGSRYIGLAKVTALSQTAGSQVICTLEAQNGGGSDEARWTNPANSTRGTLWMVLPTETETGQLKVECNAGTSSATFNTELTLIPAL